MRATQKLTACTPDTHNSRSRLRSGANQVEGDGSVHDDLFVRALDVLAPVVE